MKKDQIHLIVGYGQIGKAIEEVLSDKYSVFHIDKEDTFSVDPKFKIIMHICFPYDNKFIETAQEYIKFYMPELVIIHSTVDIGTTRRLGTSAVHSPVRGVHPDLEEGVRTFVKYFGCSHKPNAKKAGKIFSNLGIYSVVCEKPEETEAGKLLSTTYYGFNIIFMHYVKDYCDKYKLDFNTVYRHFNLTYNQGYIDLDREDVVRPVLTYMEGKIGGHCVINNCEILKQEFKPAEFIIKKNKEL